MHCDVHNCEECTAAVSQCACSFTSAALRCDRGPVLDDLDHYHCRPKSMPCKNLPCCVYAREESALEGTQTHSHAALLSARHQQSHPSQATLFGLWLMPPIFCVQLHYWRFLAVSERSLCVSLHASSSLHTHTHQAGSRKVLRTGKALSQTYLG